MPQGPEWKEETHDAWGDPDPEANFENEYWRY